MQHAHTTDDLTALIKEKYRSKAAFAKDIDIPAHTLYSILAGDSFTTCSLASALAITRALGLDPYAFSEGRLEPATQIEQAALVPVYDKYRLGEKPWQSGALPVPKQLVATHPKAFVLRLQDNAMNRILPPGFLALVAPCSKLDETKVLYAVSIENAPAVVRKVILHDNGYTLAPVSLDPTYQPMLINNTDESAPVVQAVGRVIWYCSPID